MKKIQKLVLMLGLGLILTTPVLALIPQFSGRAEAAPYSEDSITDKAAAWALGRATAKCINDITGLSGAKALDEDAAKEGKWGNWDGTRHVGEYVGLLVEGQSSDDDKVDCEKVIVKTLAVTGIDYVTALCGMGYTREHGSPCTAGSGRFLLSDSVGSTTELKDGWNNVFRKEYLENKTLTEALTPAVKYVIYYYDFKQQCGNGEGGGFTVTPWDPDNGVDDHSYHLAWYDDGALEDSYVVSSDKGSGDVVDLDGWKMLDDSGNNDDRMGCGEIAKRMNDNSAAFETALKEDEEAGRTQGGGGAENAEIDTSCGGFTSIAFNPLKWIACPLVNGMSAAAGALDSGIMQMLCVDESQVFSANAQSTCNTGATADGTADGYKKAWNAFRLIALGLLAITGLVMILSQTIGLEIFDAYTIKKVLPRLLFAAIGITLSWELMQFFVGLSNVLGVGIRGLIYAPFHTAGIDQQVLGGGTTAVAALTTLGAFALLQVVGVLSLVLTGFLAILIAFFVLVLRNILVIMLIILAPIAIVAYILPNTEKYWKLWWEWFSKALLVFPIITAFIAAGHIFSAIATAQGAQQSGITGTVTNMAGFIGYFAPYFLIPLAFRFAGGALGTIGGFVNDRNRGVFDGLKKFRRNKAAYNFQRLQNQSRWDPNSKLGNFGNKVGTWATDPTSNAAYSLRDSALTKAPIIGSSIRRSGYKVASAIEHAQVEQSSKLFEEINKMGFNDKGLRALSGMHYDFSEPVREQLKKEGLYMQAPKSIEDIQKVGQILETYGQSGTEKIGGQALHASSGRLSTLFQDPEMGKASIGAAGIMGLAAHGFASSRDLTNAANYLAGGKYTEQIEDKFDDVTGEVMTNDKGEVIKVDKGGFGGGTEAQAGFALAVAGQSQLLGSRSRPEAKNGYGVMYDGHGKFLDGMVSKDKGGGERMSAVLDTFDSHALAAAKGGAIKAVRPEIVKRLRGERGEGRLKAQEDQLFSWVGPYSQASQDVKVEALDIIDRMSGGKKLQTRVRTDRKGEVVTDDDGNPVTYSYTGYDAGSIGERYERYIRAETDPAVRGGAGGGEEGGEPGGGAGGGGS
jgi:hypothetical protein